MEHVEIGKLSWVGRKVRDSDTGPCRFDDNWRDGNIEKDRAVGAKQQATARNLRTSVGLATTTLIPVFFYLFLIGVNASVRYNPAKQVGIFRMFIALRSDLFELRQKCLCVSAK